MQTYQSPTMLNGLDAQQADNHNTRKIWRTTDEVPIWHASRVGMRPREMLGLTRIVGEEVMQIRR